MTKYVVRLCAIALLLSGSILVMSCSDSGVTNERANTSTPAPNTGTPSNTQPPKDAKYGGAVDTVNCYQISGWVWNSASPNEDIKVDISVDNKLIGTIPAKNPRPDLQSGPGTANYGFVMLIPAELKDGNPHTASAKVSGSGYEIKVWEKIQPTFTCKPKAAG